MSDFEFFVICFFRLYGILFSLLTFMKSITCICCSIAEKKLDVIINNSFISIFSFITLLCCTKYDDMGIGLGMACMFITFVAFCWKDINKSEKNKTRTERCFIVNENSALYYNCIEFFKRRYKNNEAIKEFFKNNEIEATVYNVDEKLKIAATDNDLVKFKKQFEKFPVFNDGEKLYVFRKNSPIGKAYSDLRLVPLHFMPLCTYIDEPLTQSNTRQFMYEGKLYVSIEAEGLNNNTKMPDDWKEIKRSEFYTILEKFEELEA